MSCTQEFFFFEQTPKEKWGFAEDISNARYHSASWQFPERTKDYIRHKSSDNSKQLGRKLSLWEIEDFCKSPGACPECKSAEGFWFIAKRESTFFQCKHCAAILETCKVSANLKELKHFKLVIKLHR